jgi:hypothetical protein
VSSSGWPIPFGVRPRTSNAASRSVARTLNLMVAPFFTVGVPVVRVITRRFVHVEGDMEDEVRLLPEGRMTG